MARTEALVTHGCAEIVLTGVDIASYGADLPGRPALGDVARRLLARIPECGRLRLSSLDPAAIDEGLWTLIGGKERLLPHLHLSIQSGDGMVLKRMKRRHGRAQALEICRRARALRPDIALGADLIAGFPTETDGMHRNTLDFVEEAALTFLHVFPYSPRSGTPAARMPQLAGEIVKARAAGLRELGARRLAAFLRSRIGQRESVLVESPGTGRTAHFVEVDLPDGLRVGSVVPFHATGLNGERLTGHV